MLEVIYYVASSLDGYIADSDGGVEWLSKFEVAGEDHGASRLQASADALLLGSHTYEFALKLGHWPSPEKPSWVFTRRTLPVLHPSIALTRQSPAEVVASLAAKGLRCAWLMGGGKLAASFQRDGLITRYVISICPILIGSGVPLFAPQSAATESLRLVSARPFPSGIVQLTYEHALRRSKSKEHRRRERR